MIDKSILKLKEATEEKYNDSRNKFSTWIVIPTEIALNKEISPNEKMLLMFINSLDNGIGCTASNEFLASLLNIDKRSVSRLINKLIKEKFIYKILTTSNERILTANTKYVNENDNKSDRQIVYPDGQSGVKNLSQGVVPACDININKKLTSTSLSLKKIEVRTDACISSVPQVFSDNSADKPIEIKRTLRRRILTEGQIRRSDILVQRLSKEPVTNTRRKYDVVVSDIVNEVLEFWKEEKFSLPNSDTKSFLTTVQRIKGLLSGRLLEQKFSVDDIKQTIIKLNMAAFDENYMPTKSSSKQFLQKIKLSDFIYNPYSNNGNSSIFLEYFKKEPKLAEVLVTDAVPKGTERIKRAFEQYFCKGKKIIYNVHQENCFRTAAIKLREFCKVNSELLDLNTSEERVSALMDMMKDESLKGSTITPGWLSSDSTFNYRFPQYLERSGIMAT